jgi:hypothetical protein
LITRKRSNGKNKVCLILPSDWDHSLR